MTTSEPAVEKPPSVYARADAASRQIVLQIGLGVVAFVLGSILSVGAAARLGERLGPLESDWAVLTYRWVFERLWLITLVPLFGYAIGRFTQTKPTRFALTAAISGETFSVLLVTAINGFDYLLDDVSTLIGRGVTLFLGMVVTARAVQAGKDAAAAAQVEANATAAQRKAEYAEFLAAAEGKAGTAPTAPAGPGAAPAPAATTASPPAAAPSPTPAPESVRPLPDPLPRGGEGDT